MQARSFALTPFVPLLQAGEGERAIGRTAVRPYIPLLQAGVGERAAPLSHSVGEGQGVRASYYAPLTPAATLASVLVSVLGVS